MRCVSGGQAVALVMAALLLGGCEAKDLPRLSVDRLLQGPSSLPPSPPTADDGAASPPPAAAAGPQVTLAAGQGVAAGRTAAVPGMAGEPVTLDFAVADITAVVQSVLGDMLGLPFAVDPRVAGKITLQSAVPLPRNAVLPLLEDALRMNGAALIQARGRYEVVPGDGARFGLGTVQTGAVRGPGWRTQIVPLRFASTQSVVKALEPILPAGTGVQAVPSHNAVILTGSATEVANLMDAIAVFDVDVMAGKSFGLFPLQIAEARTVAEELDAVFGTKAEGLPNPAAVPPVRFMAIGRMNAVLAISADAETMVRVEGWVAKLDQVAEGNQPDLFVYRVRNGRAAYLADLLSKLYPDDFVGKAVAERTSAVAPDRASATVQSGKAAGSSDTASAQAAASALTQIRRTETAATAAAASPFAGSDDSQSQRGSGTRIVADTVNNNLLIQARPALIRRIQASLRKIDVMPAQITLEATIIEVQLNNELSLGTRFYLNSAQHAFQFTPDKSSTIGAVVPGFSYLWSAGSSKAVVDALRAVTEVNVVSSPTMMVLDNETAQLQVGDQVPVITSTAQSVQSTDAPVVNQVEYHDTGVILTVTPRVTASGTVILDIIQEVSDVTATTSSSIDSPTFQRRRFQSSVAVVDSQTLALGGLIRVDQTRSHSAVPGLADVPVVGALFGHRSDTVGRTELLVMITPHVVRNAAEAAAATEEIRRRIRSVAMPEPKVTP